MFSDPSKKYPGFAPIDLNDRQWPSRTIQTPPIWCSVDLRDGNQALIDPMGHDRKRRMFEALVALGFKEIEVGFPAASQTDFDFVRWLIEEDRIPPDVTIQVLVQCRKPLIERTYEAIRGARSAIVHFYNSTSTLQRRVVFDMDMAGITDIAVQGAQWAKDGAQTVPETDIRFQYSPESFTGTELSFAKNICEAVMEVIEPTEDRKIILNLPATVEMASANAYADQIEWFHRNVASRDRYILSLHPHNDRGTGVGAAELGLLAGADRIEGTLFGNGERCGNVDIVTLALNMYTQGINPNLDFSDINDVVRMTEYCNQLPVHPRHPYAGELVYTSFSGSHQDAIKKGFAAAEKSNSPEWAIPYLPIDPQDVGRSYEAVIRVNSQSGKGGIGFLLERERGVKPPRRMLIEFSSIIQARADREGHEVEPDIIWEDFKATYLAPDTPRFRLIDYALTKERAGDTPFHLSVDFEDAGNRQRIEQAGNGPLDALVKALGRYSEHPLQVNEYKEHALAPGSDARAMAYVELVLGKDGAFGAGRQTDILGASFDAVFNALNRLTGKTTR